MQHTVLQLRLLLIEQLGGDPNHEPTGLSVVRILLDVAIPLLAVGEVMGPFVLNGESVAGKRNLAAPEQAPVCVSYIVIQLGLGKAPFSKQQTQMRFRCRSTLVCQKGEHRAKPSCTWSTADRHRCKFFPSREGWPFDTLRARPARFADHGIAQCDAVGEREARSQHGPRRSRVGDRNTAVNDDSGQMRLHVAGEEARSAWCPGRSETRNLEAGAAARGNRKPPEHCGRSVGKEHPLPETLTDGECVVELCATPGCSWVRSIASSRGGAGLCPVGAGSYPGVNTNVETAGNTSDITVLESSVPHSRSFRLCRGEADRKLSGEWGAVSRHGASMQDSACWGVLIHHFCG